MTHWMELPPEEEREALLDSLADLVEIQGAADFLHRPILRPNTTSFPDAFRDDLDGAIPMLRRVLAWARLDGQPFAMEVRDAERIQVGEGTWERHSGAVAWYEGRDETTGELHFGLTPEAFDSPDKLAGTLLHECAHAFRDHQGLVVEDRALEEQLTDLTAIFLGGGVFVANNAFRYEARLEGNASWSRSEQVGYLGPNAACFALATMVRARNQAGDEACADDLESVQRRLFKASLDVLPSRAELRARLGLPLQDPSPPVFNVPSIVTSLPPPAPEPLLSNHPEGPFALRRQEARVGLAATIGVLAGFFVVMVLRADGVAVPPLSALLGLCAAPLGRHWFTYRCNARGCDCPVDRLERVCPGCNTRLNGVLRRDGVTLQDGEDSRRAEDRPVG